MVDWPSIKSLSAATSKVSESCSKRTKQKLVEILGKHEQIFKEGMGTVKGIRASLKLKEGAQPKFCKARSVAYSLKPKVEEERTEQVSRQWRHYKDRLQ
jgi:hypothetical protein